MTTPTTDPELNSDNPALDADEAAAQAAAAKEKEMELEAQRAADEGDNRLNRFLAEKRSANKEAQKLKEQLKDQKTTEKDRDKALADLKKYQDAEKTVAERLEARAKDAEEAAAAAKAETTTLRYQGHAQDAGVLKEYRDYAVSEFAKSDEEDPDKFYKTFKTDHPAMFNGKPGVGPTAKGGPGSPTYPDEVAAAIAELEEMIPKAKGMERVALTKRLTQLKSQKGASK